MPNFDTIKFYLDAKAPCIWIYTYEEARAIDDLKRYCFENNAMAFIWSITSGLKRMQITNAEKDYEAEQELKNPDVLLNHIKEKTSQSGTTKDHLWILRDFSKALQQYPFLYRHIRDLKESGSVGAYQPIIIITPEKNIPKELDKLFTFVDYETMDNNELLEIVEHLSRHGEQKYPEEHHFNADINAIVVKNLKGLTFIEAANIIKRSFTRSHTIDNDFIMQEKIKVIQKTEVLEYHVPEKEFDHIGGNDNFKEWVKTLEVAMQPEAQTFGCSAPKGYLSVGVPGSGKKRILYYYVA